MYSYCHQLTRRETELRKVKNLLKVAQLLSEETDWNAACLTSERLSADTLTVPVNSVAGEGGGEIGVSSVDTREPGGSQTSSEPVVRG